MRNPKKNAAPKRAVRLNAEDWLRAARDLLIHDGFGQVKVLVLAQRLGVSTGSFYWHFKGLPALHAALIVDWETTNTAPLIDACNAHPGSGAKQFDAIMDVWVDETDYSPAWDSAMRDWARSSGEVERAVRRVDGARIALLRGAFTLMGYGDHEAFVRARITYYHQVGYYALKIIEPKAVRLRAKPLFNAVLMGKLRPPPDGT